MAQNHVFKDDALEPVDNIQKDEFRSARLFSTAKDLKKFMDHIKQEPYASFLMDKYGVIAKDGGSKGIRAQVYSDLENHCDFVLLANYDGMPFFDTIDDMVDDMDVHDGQGEEDYGGWMGIISLAVCMFLGNCKRSGRSSSRSISIIRPRGDQRHPPPPGLAGLVLRYCN